jgi:multidrug efflux pump subunit AcrA (membrane-fusion protein)
MKLHRPRIILLSVVGALAIAGVATAWVRAAGPTQASSDRIPLAPVQRGSVNLDVNATGELQASHVTMLSAPPIGGDTLQITKLVHTGERVKKGDIVMSFDPSGQEFKLEQSRSDLEQAEQEIARAGADAEVLTAKDKVALLKAHYDVRKAELDVGKNELVSKIEAEKNQLALDQAMRALAELESDIKSHAQSGQADVSLAQEKYNKAKLGMDAAEQNLRKMEVAAPMDGLMSIKKNTGAAGGILFTGMTLPDYRAGDQVQPGSSIAQVVDPMEMNLVAHIPERERSNLHKDESVEVKFYALPDHLFRGTVDSVAGMSSQSIFFDSNAGGNFDVTVKIPDLDSRLRPGLTADLRFLGDVQKDVLFIPRIAVFVKEGKHVVFVSSGSGYQQKEVKVTSQNESRDVIDGIAERTQVALRDPTAPAKSPPSVAGAGGAP